MVKCVFASHIYNCIEKFSIY